MNFIPTALPASASQDAQRHLRDILTFAFEHSPNHASLVVADAQCPLAITLTSAYRACLPNARFIQFEGVNASDILSAIDQLAPKDLVVLIQSSSFRLEAFRIRIELFKRSLKVIEHPHLASMDGELECLRYIDALAYDPDYLRPLGAALKGRIDCAQSARVDSGGAQLIFDGGLEPAKLNVGDYREMSNIGGQFPVGEVFTEARDLEAVNGQVRIAVFGDTSFKVNRPEHPITLEISRGRVVNTVHATPEFEQVLSNIRADEGEVWLRELGFGLNRALTPQRMVSDIGTFERMCGVHLSLGAKHALFNKPQIRRAAARHHVDVFAVTQGVFLDEQRVFSEGRWTV
jgi:aminopeptidase